MRSLLAHQGGLVSQPHQPHASILPPPPRMSPASRTRPMPSVPGVRLDVRRHPEPPDEEKLRAFARALVELALQLKREAEEERPWTP